MPASALPALLPVTTAAAESGGLVPAEHIITALYAYPGLPAWSQVTGNAPTVGAAIVDMCAADGSGSGCDGSPWQEQPDMLTDDEDAARDGSARRPARRVRTACRRGARPAGLDGYGDMTVEQTGAQTSCSTGSPVDSGW